MRFVAPALAFVLSPIVSCSPASTAPENPGRTSSSAAVDLPTAAPALTTSAAPAASAAAGEPPPEGDARPPEPPFKGEEPAGGKVPSGEAAWAYWPNYTTVGLHKLKAAAGTKATFFEFGSNDATFTVPIAFTSSAVPPKAIAKGDVVLATVVTSGVCGVVEDAKEDQVKVAYLWGGKKSGRDFPKAELMKLEGKLHFGAPVLARKDDGWVAGALVHTHGDTAWIAPHEFGQEEHKVPLASVRPIDVNKKRKKGDKVVVCSFDTMGCIETTVVGPKNDGLSWEVALPADYSGPAGENAKSVNASICMVSSIPK